MRERFNLDCRCTSKLHRTKRRLLIAVWLFAVFDASALKAQTVEQINRQAAADIAASKLDTAISELRAVSLRFPNNGPIQLNLGLALVKENCRSWKGCKTPLTASVLYMLEESNRRTGHVEEAKVAFHQLITRYPESAWTHYLMGNAYEDQQQLDKAINEYKQAIEKDPAIPNANFAIGYIYWRQQDTEHAREWLTKEANKGCHALANLYLGEIACAERDLQTAEKLYRRSLECDPSSADVHLRLGITLGDEKRYAEAITQLKEAIRLQPDASSAHYHLAEIYTRTARPLQAKAEYDKVRKIQAAKDNGVDVTAPQNREHATASPVSLHNWLPSGGVSDDARGRLCRPLQGLRP